jgi:hypothetical protein
MAFLKPPVLPEEIEPLPKVVAEAIASGIWTLIAVSSRRVAPRRLPY